MSAPPETSRRWTIPLTAYTSPPLTENSRLHWRAKARIVKALKDLAITYTRAHRIPALDRFTVILHYAPRDRRHRDGDNLTPTVKPLVDGYCWVHRQQDSHEHYVVSPPVIHPATGEPGRLWLEVVDLGDTT